MESTTDLSIWPTAALILALGVGFFLPAPGARAQEEPADEPVLAPAPGLTVEQVVEAQLIGLQEAADADTPDDRGMRIVWNFAAPANQQATGPFERFDAMVRSAPYDILVGHTDHRIVRVEHAPEESAARAIIEITHGQEVTYFLWLLSQPAEGDQKDCWVTDGVFPVEPETITPDQVV